MHKLRKLLKTFTVIPLAGCLLGALAAALLAYYLALDSSDTILMMVGYAWGGFGASFGPVLILFLIWRKINKYGALAGMLAGAVTIFLVKNYGNYSATR
ncbi:MAG: hypothetical protein D3904_17670 [Candidatus Electrothrix sp. EH2]|nr:hypothetical protein [Candidatus Electrothrix sp. EH2]